MGKDYYKLLGVEKGAGEADLKKGKGSLMSIVMIRPTPLKAWKASLCCQCCSRWSNQACTLCWLHTL